MSDMSCKHPVDKNLTLYPLGKEIRRGVVRGIRLKKRYLYGVIWLEAPESRFQGSVPGEDTAHAWNTVEVTVGWWNIPAK